MTDKFVRGDLRICEYCREIVHPGEEHVAPEKHEEFDLSERFNGICIVRSKDE